MKKRYSKYKRKIDVILSTAGLIALSPVFLGLAAAIKLDSKGPVFFRQKRVGIHKTYFYILKFRTMRTDTPQDRPTHMLENPDQYITRVGKFLRKTSLDELPQMFNILKGDMSIIGPRPALWNQYDLIAERDRYGANDVMPGLTGWAQVNGRDELEIPKKARLDGEYVKHLSFRMDCICFLKTIMSVIKRDGVVEGGTGEIKRKNGRESGGQTQTKTVLASPFQKESLMGGAVMLGILSMIRWKRSRETVQGLNIHRWKGGWIAAVALPTIYGSYTLYLNGKKRMMPEDSQIHPFCSQEPEKSRDQEEGAKQDSLLSKETKRILITGADSYIGQSVESWLLKENERYGEERYQVTTLDMVSEDWAQASFSGYDAVFHVAGIVHVNTGKNGKEQEELYYRVNRDLAVAAAEKAKAEGAGQFLFMSSMSIYSGCQETVIRLDTEPKPLNVYGDSKWQADQRIRELEDETFHVAVLRPPMIYGKGCKGNYRELAKLAGTLPVFPMVKNRRSMLYIDNLCRFVQLLIDERESGIFFPQNREYSNTSELAWLIAKEKRHPLVLLPWTGGVIRLMQKMPGRVGTLLTKAFGELVYEMGMSEWKEEYRVRSFKESIWLTEGKR